MGDSEGHRIVSSTALWRGDRRPAQIVQVSQLEQDIERAPQQGESGMAFFLVIELVCPSFLFYISTNKKLMGFCYQIELGVACYLVITLYYTGFG